MVEKLWETGQLGLSNGKSLQNTLFYYLTVGFGFRGCHESRQLQWGDVTVKRNDEGREFLQFTERKSKTRTGESGIKPRSFQPKLFETGTDRCPIKMYREFAKHRPQTMNEPDSPFYLSVKTKYDVKDTIWYAAQAMGKNTLGKMMSNMADGAGLEGKITNHSLRRKTCQNLMSHGVAPMMICQLTGHRNVNSLSNYTVANLSEQRKMSDILTGVDEKKNVEKKEYQSKIETKETSGIAKRNEMFSAANIHGNVTVNVHYNISDANLLNSQVVMPGTSKN